MIEVHLNFVLALLFFLMASRPEASSPFKKLTIIMSGIFAGMGFLSLLGVGA